MKWHLRVTVSFVFSLAPQMPLFCSIYLYQVLRRRKTKKDQQEIDIQYNNDELVSLIGKNF